MAAAPLHLSNCRRRPSILGGYTTAQASDLQPRCGHVDAAAHATPQVVPSRPKSTQIDPAPKSQVPQAASQTDAHSPLASTAAAFSQLSKIAVDHHPVSYFNYTSKGDPPLLTARAAPDIRLGEAVQVAPCNGRGYCADGELYLRSIDEARGIRQWGNENGYGGLTRLPRRAGHAGHAGHADYADYADYAGLESGVQCNGQRSATWKGRGEEGGAICEAAHHGSTAARPRDCLSPPPGITLYSVAVEGRGGRGSFHCSMAGRSASACSRLLPPAATGGIAHQSSMLSFPGGEGPHGLIPERRLAAPSDGIGMAWPGRRGQRGPEKFPDAGASHMLQVPSSGARVPPARDRRDFKINERMIRTRRRTNGASSARCAALRCALRQSSITKPIRQTSPPDGRSTDKPALALAPFPLFARSPMDEALVLQLTLCASSAAAVIRAPPWVWAVAASQPAL
ncbi:hypothetical protein BS50DRAFT_584854 [Corynespora cassiicola Philippines]|uniref:Uncharacterized protein n=1 Tax=Corynespora cassiicola Philippines TaxID=1448308 RepID=A0A2T2P1G5_CORCC|nr:hypothetical protein BS50DRAFT_584854 [Corynespora cassiicola Philippines]